MHDGLRDKAMFWVALGGVSWGVAVVPYVIGWAHAPEIIVSDRGVRWGLALELSREFCTGFSTPKTGA